MKKRHQIIKKKKHILSLYRSNSIVTIAGFPLKKGAFHNELWSWPDLKPIK